MVHEPTRLDKLHSCLSPFDTNFCSPSPLNHLDPLHPFFLGSIHRNVPKHHPHATPLVQGTAIRELSRFPLKAYE